MKKVDRLGRIVVPIELRQKYGMTEGKEVEILDSGDGVTVKMHRTFLQVMPHRNSSFQALAVMRKMYCKGCKEL